VTHSIMVGCDLHDKTMLLKIAEGREKAETRSIKNTVAGRVEMIRMLRERARMVGGGEVMFAYEASGQGFGLYDELTEAGFTCYVLAPTKIARSMQHRRRKTDEQDALQILELLKAHVLAGNPLPKNWIPGPQTRDGRQLVRMRLDVGEKLTVVKAQVQGLLKGNKQRRPGDSGKGWNATFRRWLAELASPAGTLGPSSRSALASLLRQLSWLEEEIDLLDRQVLHLALTDRYRDVFYELLGLKGVGRLTAMVFLTELGDLSRFSNRRQIGAYLGLAPSSNESGDRDGEGGRGLPKTIGHSRRISSDRPRRPMNDPTTITRRTRAFVAWVTPVTEFAPSSASRQNDLSACRRRPNSRMPVIAITRLSCQIARFPLDTPLHSSH